MAPAKADKIVSLIAPVLSSRSSSRRDLAKIRGRLVWFSPCLPGVRLLTRALNSFIGSPQSDQLWDAVDQVPPSALDELRHWFDTLPSLSGHERYMWTLKPMQILELHRLGRRVVQVYMETDASLHGWGCIVRFLVDGVWTERRTSVAWPPTQPRIQVQCEAEALHQALLTFLDLVAGCAVLHVTDCEPTLDLPDRGSARSLALQRTALSIWFLCSAHGIFLSSAWVPGDEMIKSGCDSLSRDLLSDPHCASLTIPPGSLS